MHRFCWLVAAGSCLLSFSAQAAFTSLYAFGDGVCTTTNGPSGSALYYGKRYTNGRVWLEVLAERQGLAYDANKNWSYFGHYSGILVTNVGRFAPPADAATALFVIWVNDADFVWNAENYGTNLVTWNKASSDSLTNHFRAITNLYYAKGARTIVMPNAVDISKTPIYLARPAGERAFMRQRIIEYNVQFAATLNQVRATLTDLVIYSPDFFAFVDDILAHPANYGCVQPGIDGAVSDPALINKALNGPGANYVFWDDLNPSAKVHMWLADLVQERISPAAISQLLVLPGSNRLDLVNVPAGRNGSVLASGDLLDWSPVQSFSSTGVVQQVFVPSAGSRNFYRLVFPFAWTWP